MGRVLWALVQGSPCIQVNLRAPIGGASASRTLLADTGAGPDRAPFELVLRATDQRQFGGRPHQRVRLGGAIRGAYPVCTVWVEVPLLHVVLRVPAVAVPATRLPAGLDGIAAFRFLNRFTYGNFGDPSRFGLEIS
jgi:hypothetical protein